MVSSCFFFFLFFFSFPFFLVNSQFIFPLPSSSSSSSSPDVVFSCPRTCFCNVLSRIVYCSRRGLLAVPPGISSDSLQLNLNANVFVHSHLKRSNFSGLTDLGHLYMSECGIEDIDVGTFSDLVNLRWLDLSNNRLRVVKEFVFDGLNLQHLFLNGNRHLYLLPGSFEGLLTTGLYLHDCSLERLAPSVLGPLNSTVRYLWLNGNDLTGLDVGLRGLLVTLIHLRLGSNPLHCNCELVWLKDIFDRNPDVFKGAVAPSCVTPKRLKGRLFGQVTVSEFSCQVPAFTDIEVSFGVSGGGARLKCTASGDPTPTLYWIQPSGKATKYSAAAEDDDDDDEDDDDGKERGWNEGILTMEEVQDVEAMRGMYICIAHNDAGNVTLTINVSWNDVAAARVMDLPSKIPDVHVAGKPLHRLTTNRPQEHHVTKQQPLILVQPLTGPAKTGFSQGARDPLQDDSIPNGKQRTSINSTLIQQKPLDNNNNNDNNDNNSEQRLFTTAELVFSIVGTHLCTMLVCVVLISRIYRCRVKPKADTDDEKVSPVPGFTAGEEGKPPYRPPASHPTPALATTLAVNSAQSNKHFIVTDYWKVKPERSQI